MAKLPSKPTTGQPRRITALAQVVQAGRLTQNMIRVTLSAPEFAGLPATCAGGHCKIMLPAAGQSIDAFRTQLADGPKPVTRTYTIRNARPETREIDIDFVAHGDDGPASAWAARARAGDVIGFAGPGAPKLTEFDADFYLFAADMSAIPVVAAGLEALPRDATGMAIFEITSAGDRQQIDAPPGVTQHWLIHDDPHRASREQVRIVEALRWPEGRVRTLIAGETGVVRSLRLLLRGDRGLDRRDVYASGYWRIGLAEDEHQKVKRAESEADEARLSQVNGG
ncbi:MAG: siderophore-interacting protein [Roseicyclus sp.]|nr:siderophore-interacting protein [Roseicyclus sp.]MBO6923289.1 siderophore-interacting protein [Roseicyclus sp.]